MNLKPYKCSQSNRISFRKGRKHCWKKRKCWLPAFSLFPTNVFKRLSFSEPFKLNNN